MRKPIWVALTALGSATAAPYLRRRRARIREVAPDLRTGALWLPLDVRGPRTLALGRALTPAPRTGPSDVRVTTRLAPGLPGAADVEVTVVEPVARAGVTGAILWLHGGGFIMGRPEIDLHAATGLARDLGVLVAMPRYRLAPEDPFPAGLDDCCAALRMLVVEGEDLGVDSARIAVVGISAGGGLAAALAQRVADQGCAAPARAGDPVIAAQVLVYPMLDDRTVHRGVERNRGTFVWTSASNRFAWESYLAGPAGAPAAPRWAVPARRCDLADQPPTWIGVGELDLFYDEDVAYAEALAAAGVAVELHVVAGMYHGADRLAAPVNASLRDFRSTQRAFLAQALT